MKKTNWLLLLFCIFSNYSLIAQNIGINNDGSTAHPSAMLDVKSSSKGILIPRVALTATNDASTINSPAASLLIYNTASNGSGNTAVAPGFYYWKGNAWTKIVTNDSANNFTWNSTGNTGAVLGQHFIGNIDNKPLQFRVNNEQAGLIDNVQINTFFGLAAGKSLTTGYGSIGIGQNALNSMTSGYDNIGIGEGALGKIVIADGNTAVGKFALGNSTAPSNTAFGRTSLLNTTTGADNTGVGRSALFSNTTGSQNTAVGRNALQLNISGSQNTAIGYLADIPGGNFSNATVIGSNATANCSNCVILGAVKNINGATNNVSVGIGTNNPTASLDVRRTTTVTANFYGTQRISHFNFGDAEHTYIRGGKDSSNVLINDYPYAGNVGIGTGSPLHKLDVNGDVGAGPIYQPGSTGEKITFFPSGLNANYGIGVQNNLLQIYTDIENSDVAFGYGTSAAFTEKIRLKGNGRIGIGTNNPEATLDVRRTTNTTANFYGSTVISHFNFGDAEHTYIRGGKAGSNVLIADYFGAGSVGIGTSNPGYKLDVAGGIRCTLLTQTSDARLKTNIHPLPFNLDKIAALNGYTYNWKDSGMDQSMQIGLLAQEVQKVFPELVNEDTNGILSVNYTGLIPVLIEALKDLKKETDEIKKMKADIEMIKKQIQH